MGKQKVGKKQQIWYGEKMKVYPETHKATKLGRELSGWCPRSMWKWGKFQVQRENRALDSTLLRYYIFTIAHEPNFHIHGKRWLAQPHGHSLMCFPLFRFVGLSLSEPTFTPSATYSPSLSLWPVPTTPFSKSSTMSTLFYFFLLALILSTLDFPNQRVFFIIKKKSTCLLILAKKKINMSS